MEVAVSAAMAQKNNVQVVLCACLVTGFTLTGLQSRADDPSDTQQQLRNLQQKNQSLEEQLRKQQALIESLTHAVNQIQEVNTKRGRELEHLEDELKDSA